MAVEENGTNTPTQNSNQTNSTNSPCIKVTKTSLVLPINKSDKPPCPLTAFDLPYITFYYNQKLLLYKTAKADTENNSYENIIATMKDGLEAVLEYFYPLAGRIAKDEVGALVVDCSGDSLAGVEFIEASAEDVSVDSLTAEGEAAELLQQVVPYTGVMNLEGLHRPLLAVQVTKLKDGLAVGCAFNHAILDGHSTWHFMSAWAELTRTQSSTILSVPQPFHNRSKARPTRVKVELPPSQKAHELADPNGPPKPLVAKVFSFSEATLNRLKSKVNSNLPPNSKPFSTFQSLGVHVWRCVCRARGLKPEDYTVFAIFMDCRSRVDPPMTESYFGNLIQCIFTVTASGLLLASPAEFGAGLIQKVIYGHDAKAIEGRLEEYEAKPKMFHFTDAGINCVAVGSSPRFRVYDVDFGFGKPDRVRSGSNNKFDGMMYLYPGKGGDSKSIDVELTLQPEAMSNLDKDPEFVDVGVPA